jgi:hypothetical protein
VQAFARSWTAVTGFFSHALQADVRIVLQIRPWPLLSSSLPVHYSLILPFIAVYSELPVSIFKIKHLLILSLQQEMFVRWNVSYFGAMQTVHIVHRLYVHCPSLYLKHKFKI